MSAKMSRLLLLLPKYRSLFHPESDTIVYRLKIPQIFFTSKEQRLLTKQVGCVMNTEGRRYFSKNCSSTENASTCIDQPQKWPSEVKVHYKFHKETEDAMNEQINVEFKAYYYYLSMAAFFGRVDVALPGCQSFFIQMHQEEYEHAMRFLNYVNMRGGEVRLCPILPPDKQDWKCPLNCFKTALQLEVEVSDKLVNVNTIAEKHGDLNASDFIITGFMEDQMKSVNEMARFVTLLSGVGDYALARFMFDKDLLDNYVLSEYNILKPKVKSVPREK